ncbi:hypothetical protein LAUMK191_04103 [Mycobacterium attenuatum]|uniref:hypothetical protein n=1 Tax=Mycobacterium attenuatum TaxID=2341086 RepID=UPI000F034130|nr:hypothetical protein [Mycobacterium attenuatum]VBA57616.1 hypothetical protein LAUMK191_04103 [Mycobacterium attenuatum]
MKINMAELPTEVFQHIADLRKESAQYRTQRNKAREEVGSLRTTVAHLRAEVEALRNGLAQTNGK